MPCNFNNLPAWDLGGGNWLLADQDFDYAALQQQNAAPHLLTRAMGLEMDSQDVGGSSCTIDTNRLWLEITNVANGLAYLNLHNSTNQVYAIWSTTNLPANWNVETEVWPDTNQTVTPFALATLGRPSLFLRAEDWTGVDSNGDGIPDWWLWKFFGDLSGNATNLDSQGHTLLHDYTNGFDPNVILFDLSTSNRYVNIASVPLQIELNGGIPSYLAVLINDTNLAGANWQPFTGTNLTVNLGPADGVYSVRVGLRGLPVDAYQTWQQMDLTLDTQTPVIIVTNPVLSVISQPMVQLQGYVQDSLGQMSYDLSNAAGVWTSQPGFVTDLGFDTNLFAFTTNFFQCYDVVLTNGVNTIILHATDLAGNTATTNISVTLDYSGDTTAPALTVTWPQDGTAVSGSSFTFAGQVDDATARVTATIVDAGGDTNTVEGLVERDGTVWAANLPLAAGTNWLTVTAQDAAGNLSSTNLAVVQSGVMVTIQPLTSDQLNRPLVIVYGTVSDGTVEVYVNDVQAGVDPETGDWGAGNVPVSPSGAALLDVEIYPAPGGGGGTSLMSVNDLLEDPAPIGSQRVSQPQAPMVQVVGYSKKIFSAGFSHYDDYRRLYSEILQTGNWVEGVGGMYHRHSHNTFYLWDGSTGTSFDRDLLELLSAENPYCLDCLIIMENGTLNAPTENKTFYAQTALKTGKPTGPGQTNLYLVKVLVEDAKGHVVDPARVRVPGWTLTPSADDPDWGNFLVWGPGGATIGMTPQAGVSYDTFGFLVNNVTLQIIDANAGVDLTDQTNTVIVGQQMNLRCQLSVTMTNVTLTNFQWTVPGYAISNYVVAADSSSAMVVTNFPLNNSNVVFYWVDGASNRVVHCTATVQGKTLTAQATLNVLRPTAKISPYTTSVNVFDNLLTFEGPTMSGITFSNTITVPAGFSGSVIWAQVIYNRVRKLQDTNLIWHVETENGANPYGDTPIPYQAFDGTNPVDNPRQVLPSSGYLRCEAGNSFEMWMMFQPSGGIWVPLRAVNWSWSGSATNNSNLFGGVYWQLESGTNSINPTDFDTQTYPIWNSDVRNRQWIPPGPDLQ